MCTDILVAAHALEPARRDAAAGASILGSAAAGVTLLGLDVQPALTLLRGCAD